MVVEPTFYDNKNNPKVKDNALINRYKLLLNIIRIQTIVSTVLTILYFLIGILLAAQFFYLTGSLLFLAVFGYLVYRWVKYDVRRYLPASYAFLAITFVTAAAFAFAIGGDHFGPLVLFWVFIIGAITGTIASVVLIGIASVICTVAVYILDYTGFNGIIVLEGAVSQAFGIFVWLVMLSIITAGLVVLISAFNNINKELATEAERLASTSNLLEGQRDNSSQVAQQILSTSSQISVISQQQKAGMSQQLAAITEVTSSIEELAAAAAHIAGLAGQVLKASQSSSNRAEPIGQQAEQLIMIAEQGLEALQLSRQASRLVAERFIALDQRLTELANSSSELTSVATIIKSIADETHLLALNAAIEAAGAGEYGQRFGVVAQEVKALADRTVESADEVQQVLAKVSQLLVQASSDAQHGRLDAQQAARQVVEAAQTISSLTDAVSQNAVNATEIKEEVETASMLAEQIDMATRQQRTASNQLVESMHQMQLVAQKSAGGTNELSQAVVELEELSSRIVSQLN
jgi:methyl-accepting chemotaxis protein